MQEWLCVLCASSTLYSAPLSTLYVSFRKSGKRPRCIDIDFNTVKQI